MENPIQETTDLFRFQITEEQEEERVDKCIAALIDSLSRSFIQKMIKEGRVCINGLPVKASYQVKAGDDLSFLLPKAQEPDIEPEDIPLDIRRFGCQQAKGYGRPSGSRALQPHPRQRRTISL